MWAAAAGFDRSFRPVPRKENPVVPMAEMMPLAAAGWAFLVWLCGGGVGLAVLVFIVLKVLGK